MKRIQRDVNIVFLVCLESALVCFVAGCADVPKYYWVKSGITNEQIRKDNFFCADMTAQKPPAYSRGSAFYYAPLDQPAYQKCMRSLGYRRVTEAELERERFAAATGPLIQLDDTRKLCQRVTGEVGDVDSCIRWMSMNPNTSSPLASGSATPGSPGSKRSTTSLVTEAAETAVCLRRNRNDEKGLLLTVIESCDSSRSEPQ